MPSTPDFLEIDRLSVSYGPVEAVRAVSLAVARGEFVALLGPSGCGKTSLLRAIAGFIAPAGGTIRVDGRDVAGVPPRARNIGIVFQSYALFPHMSAFENVRFGLDCRGVGRAEAATRTQAALALVGLEALAARRPAQLSGGQQQRVALARALVIAPDLLLLDEPLAALDKQLRVQMQTELKSLQRRLGVTALFVTHDREEAMSMADRIVVLRDGRVCQVDTPERLFAMPADAGVAEFIGAGNLLRGPAVADGQGGFMLAPAAGFSVELPGPLDGRAAFVGFDQVRLDPVADGEGPVISARRYLGLSVELHVAYSHGVVRALLPASAPFAVGQSVRLHVARADCRLLAEA